MPKHEELSQQHELNLFFNTPVIPADSPGYKKLVEEAPYHPGYEGAVFGTNTIDNIKPLSTEDIIKLDPYGEQTVTFTNTNRLPTQENNSIAIDWSRLTIPSSEAEKLYVTNVPTESKKSGSAMKFDDQKLPVNLLSSEALLQTAAVLKFGADKYHAHNWRDGFAWSRPLAAAMRHIMAYNDGEDRDPESGLSHLAHAACCIMFLLEFEKTHPELDDRYKVDVHKTKDTSK
jgi:hypothetical protein